MSRIARIEAWPANAPLEAAYLMATGTVPGISRTIVRVTTEDGVVGLGESASPADAEALLGELGGRFVGQETEFLRNQLSQVPITTPEHRDDGQVVIDKPKTGVEIALWDNAAREAGVPLHALLGDQCRSGVAFSEYFAYRPGHEETPAEIAAYCARMLEAHESAVFEGKVAVSPLEQDIRMVAEIRAAIGMDCELRLDANVGWTAETAGRALELLEHPRAVSRDVGRRLLTARAVGEVLGEGNRAPALAAQKSVQGYSRLACGDVPQGDLDSGRWPVDHDLAVVSVLGRRERHLGELVAQELRLLTDEAASQLAQERVRVGG